MNDATLVLTPPADVAVDPSAILVAPPALIDMLPTAVYACGADGGLRWFNRRAAELWGCSPQPGDEAGRFGGHAGLFGPDGARIRRDETPMAEVLRTGTPVSGREVTVERPDGTCIVTMAHIDPVKDEAGNVIGAIGCLHDVTEAKRRDRESRKHEQYYRDLLNALPAAIYTTDAAGRITFYNEAAAALSGRRPRVGVDEWCVTWKLFLPDGTPLPHDRCPMAVALKEGRPVQGTEVVAERPDGTRIPLIPFPTPLHDASGVLVGAVNMLIDVSHRKESECRQRVLSTELNHRVKNNMQVLQGLLSGAQREAASPEAHAVLSDVARRVSAMATAQRVLYRTGDARAFDARDFVASVCASARLALGGDMAIECESVEGKLSSDTAVPLALILNELIANAARYGADERGRTALGVRLTRDSGAFTLEVEDGGPGFELSRVRRRSSGLGLVMALAGQIGGSFAVHRTPGARGARCTVRFGDDRNPRPAAGTAGPPGTPPSPG